MTRQGGDEGAVDVDGVEGLSGMAVCLVIGWGDDDDAAAVGGEVGVGGCRWELWGPPGVGQQAVGFSGEGQGDGCSMSWCSCGEGVAEVSNAADPLRCQGQPALATEWLSLSIGDLPVVDVVWRYWQRSAATL